MTKLIDHIRRQRNADLEARGFRRGYYLVHNHERHYISETVDLSALERVADRVLSDKTGWDYWIDYSHGPDTNNAPAWANIDQTDAFF